MKQWTMIGMSMLVLVSSIAHADDVQFNRDIRPILSDKCFRCHGQSDSSRKAKLRLDVRDAALDVLSPGKPEDSELLARVLTDDPDDLMPPPSSKQSLTDAEKKLLRAWIEQGAGYAGHWAFQPVAEPKVPEVKGKAWVKNSIDHFVLQQLEAKGVTPSKEASRETLIRRVSFDLTGLPPTLEEIDAFVADKSDNAYERIVDKYLAKTAYGERMASVWMDVARYSDTYGYQVDRDRFVWPWRDWVIKAFNSNMPYDQFVTEQLAGDLLPNATDDQRLATTFNRLHPQKVEGGSTPEEFRVEYVADRNHTFGTAFLGLSLECARCHEHKYDPISQEEYYQLFSFFNNIDESGLYSYFTPSIPTPTMRLMDDATKQRMKSLRQTADGDAAKLASIAKERDLEFESWLAKGDGKGPVPGQVAHDSFDNFKGQGGNKSVKGKVGTAIKLSGDDQYGLKVGNFKRSQPFSVACWINSPKRLKRGVIWHRSRAWTDAGSRGYQLLMEDGKLSASLIHFWPGNAIRIKTRDQVAINQWVHVCVTYDGSSTAAGLRLYIDGVKANTEVVRDNLYKNITGGGGNNLTIGARMRDRGFTNGLVDEIKVFNRQLTGIEVASVHDHKALADLLSVPANKLSTSQRQQLKAYYLAAADKTYQSQLEVVRKAREAHDSAADRLQEIMVMQEMPERRPAFVLRRGMYDSPTTPVLPDTPAAFSAFPENAPRNRLGLAQWLTSKEHPLTSRVLINRLWQMCFGEGLTATPEEFGTQGSPPTHPELLDWLAYHCMTNGWDMKAVIKMIVTSATYRQSSTLTPQMIARDPKNQLYGRSPSFQLPAEMLRDNALAVSGLLVDQVGGRSVKPYEVSVSFKPTNHESGGNLYRRSLYTYWKRTAPAPVMMALDASKRDVCTVKRERTSSPLQALVLLNDPQMVEAGKKLAERATKACGEDVDASLAYMFRLVTARQPSGRELKVIKSLYAEQLSDFEKNGAAVDAYLKTGQAKVDAKLSKPKVAALGVVACTLFNFDGTVRKH